MNFKNKVKESLDNLNKRSQISFTLLFKYKANY